MPRHLAHAVALACSLVCSFALALDPAGEMTLPEIVRPLGTGVPATDGDIAFDDEEIVTSTSTVFMESDETQAPAA